MNTPPTGDPTGIFASRLELDPDLNHGAWIESAVKAIQQHVGNLDVATDDVAASLEELVQRWHPLRGNENFYEELLDEAISQIDFRAIARTLVEKASEIVGKTTPLVR